MYCKMIHRYHKSALSFISNPVRGKIKVKKLGGYDSYSTYCPDNNN